MEAGGVLMGEHTIADDIPKYGLAVTGWVHPDNIVTNAAAKPGDVLILTKPIGTGTIISAKKNEIAPAEAYRAALDNMKLLNDKAATVMNKYKVKCATDITGFGLLGHTMKMADGSGVSMRIDSSNIPTLPAVMELIEMGCIPGAAFRNQEYAADSCQFDDTVDYNHKMLVLDAQTSGGLLMAVKPEDQDSIIEELKQAGYPDTTEVGSVLERSEKSVFVI